MVAANSLLLLLLTTGFTSDSEQPTTPTAWKSISDTEPPVNQDNGSGIIEKCPSREHWDNCNSHCQANCTNYDKPIPCTKICIPGCICDEGLVRGANGKCIPKKECSKTEGPLRKTCPQHEHWDGCKANCQKNCSNYKKAILCSESCAPGCICDEGHVRGANGKCIPKDKCPTKIGKKHRKRSCPPKEHISYCMGHCQKTCKDHLNPKPCPRKCQRGCVCDGSLVRGPNGKCIIPSKCPAKSDQEERVFYNEGCPDNPNACQEYCKKRGADHGICFGPRKDECICTKI